MCQENNNIFMQVERTSYHVTTTTARLQKAQTFKINWQHLRSLALNRLLNALLSRFVFISYLVFWVAFCYCFIFFHFAKIANAYQWQLLWGLLYGGVPPIAYSAGVCGYGLPGIQLHFLVQNSLDTRFTSHFCIFTIALGFYFPAWAFLFIFN